MELLSKQTNNIEPEVIGGIGEKKSNGGTQWYQQDRIYQGDAAISITTSFNPSYAIGGDKMKDSIKNIYNLLFKIFDLCGIIEPKESEKYGRTKDLLQILWIFSSGYPLFDQC